MRVKLRILHGSSQHNACCGSFKELQERVAKLRGQSNKGNDENIAQPSLQYASPHGDWHQLCCEEDFEAMVATYQDGVQQHQLGAATFRMRVAVDSPAGLKAAKHKQHSVTQSKQQQHDQPSHHVQPYHQLRSPDSVGRSPAYKRACMRDISQGEVIPTVMRQQQQQHALQGACQASSTPAQPTPVSKLSLQQQQPEVVGTTTTTTVSTPAAGSHLSWDEQVLSSIKQTVTKLHFGSRLPLQQQQQQQQQQHRVSSQHVKSLA